MLRLIIARQSMALATDVIHGRGPSKEMCTQLQPKKTILAVSMAAKGIIRTVHY